MSTRRYLGTRSGRAQGKEIADKFARKGKKVRSEIEQALADCGHIVEADAKRECPVDTGRLRSSISSRVDNEFLGDPYAEVGTNVKYAKDVEYGTSHQRAQPFLEPALDKNKDRIDSRLKKAVKEGARES